MTPIHVSGNLYMFLRNPDCVNDVFSLYSLALLSFMLFFIPQSHSDPIVSLNFRSHKGQARNKWISLRHNFPASLSYLKTDTNQSHVVNEMFVELAKEGNCQQKLNQTKIISFFLKLVELKFCTFSFLIQ
jgi:hypothetical protein